MAPEKLRGYIELAKLGDLWQAWEDIVALNEARAQNLDATGRHDLSGDLRRKTAIIVACASDLKRVAFANVRTDQANENEAPSTVRTGNPPPHREG